MTSLETRTRRRAQGQPQGLGPEPARRKTATSVLDAVQQAVNDLDAQTLRRVANPGAGLTFQPVTLLALLTYCYAHEIYGSTEVEEIMRSDAKFRKLCGGEFPDPHVIARFRRENREAIQDCLRKALRTRFSRKIDAGFVTKVQEDHVVEEATRRITMAMFIDNMELNGD